MIILYFVIKAAVKNAIIAARNEPPKYGGEGISGGSWPPDDGNNRSADGISRTACPNCGREHDMDFPKCPHCGYKS